MILALISALFHRLSTVTFSHQIAIVILGALLAVPARSEISMVSMARRHLEHGDLALAESSARQVIRADPEHADAWLVLGLAHYRGQRFVEALQAFDQALEHAGKKRTGIPVPDSGLIQFNRGSCFYQLERFGAAEKAFLAAARASHDLQPLALLNAGFSALEQGALERAETHAVEVASHVQRLPDLASLLGSLREEIAALAAERQQRSAITAGGQPQEIAGESQPRTKTAVEEQRAALRVASPQDQEQKPAASQARGLAALGKGVQARLEVGGGYDNNVALAGITGQASAIGAESAQGSAFGVLTGEIGFSGAFGDRGRWRIDYVLDQLAYMDGALDPYNVQQHLVVTQGEIAFNDWLRLGLEAQGGVAFAGLSGFSGLFAEGGGGLGVEADLKTWLTLRLASRLIRFVALDSGIDYLSATRWDIRGGARLYLGRVYGGVGLRYRLDGLGDALREVSASSANGTLQVTECQSSSCNGAYVLPLAYGGPAGLLNLGIRLWRELELSLDGIIEWRRYHSAGTLRLTGGVMEELETRRRADIWIAGGGALGYLFFGRLELGLRYEVIRNFSSIDGSAAEGYAPDYDDLNYLLHSVAATVSFEF